MKKTIMIGAIIVALFLSEFALGQNPFSRLRMEQWDTKKGMPNDMVLNVYQTLDGYIWTTGYTGLTRFDGIKFTPFNSRTVPLMKTDNIETLLYETKDSTLWIPTPNSGLLSYKNGQFDAYLSDSTSLYIYGKTPKDELLIYIGRRSYNFILFDTHTKTYKSLTNSQRIELIKSSEMISYNYMKDQSDNLWFYLDGKFYRYNNGKLNELTVKEGLDPDRRYYQIYADTRNRVWLPSTRGLFLWNGRRFELYPGMEEISFTSSGALSTGILLEDGKGGVWAATSSGVAYLPSYSDRFVFYPGNDGLLSEYVNNILKDKEGNMWFSSTANGLVKLSESKFINYSVRDGLNDNRIAAVCAVDNNTYLVATYRKLFWIRNGVVEPYFFKNKSLENFMGDPTMLYKDSMGNVWLTFTSGDIIRISKDGEKLFEPKGITQARYIFEDNHGQIWFGFGYKGIGFLNEKEEIELLSLPKVDFSSFYLSSFCKLQNGSWLVTSFNNGIILIDQEGNLNYHDDKSGLPTIGVFVCAEDQDGTVWLTTQSGVTRFKNGEFQNIDFRSGLPENSIFGFLPDHQGYVWFPSNRGLIRAQKQELNDYLDGKKEEINWQLYDDGDGMLNRQCVGARHPAITPDGRLLFPTFGGLVEVDPDQLQTNTLAPPVTINSVLIDNEDIGFNHNNIFKPGNHRYIFSFSGLSFVAPHKVKFKFRLEGYDKDWISTVGDRKAFYTNIPSGKYTFRVIACNNDGVWNETGAAYSFRIEPYFWETTLFRISSLALLLFLVWLIIKWRTRTTRKQNELLEAEVESRTSELHQANEELNQSLENLKATQTQLIQSEKMASLGELTAGIAHEIQNPLNFVNNFSEVSKELIEEMNDEIEAGSLEDVKEISEDIKQNLEKIHHHGQRASSIVKGMLEHSRAGNQKKELTDINLLADEFLRLAYHGLRAKDKSFNAEFKLELDENLPKVNVIGQEIGRVLLNLINNAFYAVSEKAKEAPDLYKPTVVLKTKRNANTVEITVKDNGNGISGEVRDKIFHPFFTTKPTGQGTGLGLSLSYDIITKGHDGHLEVETTPGIGTDFIISLPIH